MILKEFLTKKKASWNPLCKMNWKINFWCPRSQKILKSHLKISMKISKSWSEANLSKMRSLACKWINWRLSMTNCKKKKLSWPRVSMTNKLRLIDFKSSTTNSVQKMLTSVRTSANLKKPETLNLRESMNSRLNLDNSVSSLMTRSKRTLSSRNPMPN